MSDDRPRPPPPGPSLLSKALGSSSSRGNALVSGVREKLQAQGSGGLLGEALQLNGSVPRPTAAGKRIRSGPGDEHEGEPAVKAARGSLDFLDATQQGRDFHARQGRDPSLAGGGGGDNASTRTTQRADGSVAACNRHGSPGQESDEESEPPPPRPPNGRGGPSAGCGRGRGGIDITSYFGRGATGRGANGRGAGGSGRPGASGGGGRPGASGGGGRPAASSGASGANCAPAQGHHRFVVDAELVGALEAQAVPLPYREKHEHARVATDNYGLCKRGSYDAGGASYSLDTRGFANRTHRLSLPAGGQRLVPPRGQTALCVANVDTATALRVLAARGIDAAALNFANAFHAGGGYVHGARAQEEDLCRLMPTLFPLLKKLSYPLAENEAHYTHAWLARRSGSYRLEGPPLKVAIVSGAMPNLGSAKGARRGERQLQPGTEAWRRTVTLRVRAVLDASIANGHTAVILGAFGCGAFGNPPQAVAEIFAQLLGSAEFRGRLQLVVFAIVDPKSSDAGNLGTFRDVLTSTLCAAAR